MKEDRKKKRIFVYGASGHAKVVVEAIEKQGLYEVACLVDDDPSLWGKEVFGYRVLRGKAELLEVKTSLATFETIVAIGSNKIRMAVAHWLEAHGYKFVSVVHPSASISRGVTISNGTVVMAGVVINADSYIGSHAIINTAASVDHDCHVGNGVHIAPGTHLCGNVAIGSGTFVGAGVTVIPNLAIGSNVTVGAGSTIVCDVDNDVTVVGTPARVKC